MANVTYSVILPHHGLWRCLPSRKQFVFFFGFRIFRYVRCDDGMFPVEAGAPIDTVGRVVSSSRWEGNHGVHNVAIIRKRR